MPAYTRESALSRAACEKLVNERVIPSNGLPLVTDKADLIRTQDGGEDHGGRAAERALGGGIVGHRGVFCWLSQVGSPAVASLPSTSPSRMAVTGRQES